MILGLAACGKPADQAAAGPKTGAPAPQIALQKIIRGDLKSMKGWEDLKGKAVVLEFWDTWCAPCVDNIPHMNELAAKFKGKPVIFLSVTRDRQATVEKFLREREMAGNIAVEAGAAFKSFRVSGIPHTVLLDKNGVIRAFSYPSKVTPECVEALLSGAALPAGVIMEPEAEIAREPLRAGESLASFSVSVSKSGSKPRLDFSEDEFVYEGASLDELVPVLAGNPQLVEYRGVDRKFMGARYDIKCRLKKTAGVDNKARLRAAVLAGLNGAFPFTIETARVNRTVLLLKKAPGASGPATAVKEAARFSYKAGEEGLDISARGQPLEKLRERLQGWLKMPVLDETGLEGPLDYDFSAPMGSITAVNTALKKTGLRLEGGKRDIRVTSVTSIKISGSK
ncbi:MAG: hypothetical protein A2089_06435 [Elusimicrobia bacterium GWD2_63_28]|nr:MAG: hypothetical protein A2089_06435 [Elusimicrobia bacterium GWD2_63_28]